MNIVKTEIDGVLIIEPHLFRDARGYFFESFCKREFEEKVTPILDIVFISARQRVYEQLHREPNDGDVSVQWRCKDAPLGNILVSFLLKVWLNE